MANCNVCRAELPEEAKFCQRCGAPFTQSEANTSVPDASASSQSSTTSELMLAFWWQRFIAWLIDVVIIGAITFVLSLLTGFTLSLTPSWPTSIPFLNFSINGVFAALYWMLTESSNSLRGQSFGKSVMRIRVVYVDVTLISLKDAAIESIGKAFILPIDLLIGWILYPRKRQRAFNYLTRTVVVREALPIP